MKQFGNSVSTVLSRKISSQALRKIHLACSQCNFKKHTKNFYVLFTRSFHVWKNAFLSDFTSFSLEPKKRRYMIKAKDSRTLFGILTSTGYQGKTCLEQRKRICRTGQRELSSNIDHSTKSMSESGVEPEPPVQRRPKVVPKISKLRKSNTSVRHFITEQPIHTKPLEVAFSSSNILHPLPPKKLRRQFSTISPAVLKTTDGSSPRNSLRKSNSVRKFGMLFSKRNKRPKRFQDICVQSKEDEIIYKSEIPLARNYNQKPLQYKITEYNKVRPAVVKKEHEQVKKDYFTNKNQILAVDNNQKPNENIIQFNERPNTYKPVSTNEVNSSQGSQHVNQGIREELYSSGTAKNLLNSACRVAYDMAEAKINDGFLYPDKVLNQNVVLFLTDAASYVVIITSVTTAKESAPPPSHPPAAYRYPQYPGYSYSPYPPHTYPYPTAPPNPPYSHHDMCYSPNPYVHKYPIRRYLTTQYYPPPNPPPEIYQVPPSGPSQQSQQVVTSTPVSGNGTTYTTAPPTLMETYASPQATLVESYQPPPPTHYYPPPAYAPTPACYSHPTSRAIPYINAYQSSCPCPMQSCPKNVHTGPLTGDCKRSSINSISKDSMPLPPVALALPLEPASATGPPSPARGSAGMPPPPSPAGATYQAPPVSAKQETDSPNMEEDFKSEKKRKARIGKAMVRNNIAANLQHNTMLLMCNPSQNYVKREIESPKESELEPKRELSVEETKHFPEALSNSCNKTVEIQKEESQLPISLQPKEEKISQEPQEESLTVLPPVINTVAENVKVKNMKRKLSMLSEKESSSESAIPAKKKPKRGSYKLLIKKETNAVKINNGKRKLLGELCQLSKARQNRIKLRKKTRRLLNLDKEESVRRRKLPKLLQLNNVNCKSKEVNPCTETKEKRSLCVKKVNSKSVPASTEKVPTATNVERTIESVISDACLRTQEECTTKTAKCVKQQTNALVINKKSTNKVIVVSKKLKVNPKKTETNRRKSKCSEVTVQSQVPKVIKRPLILPRWSNGWIWEGESFEGKVFLNSDELTVIRRCYPAMRHEGGDKIVPKDCVLLKAGPRKNDLPFVAKIASLWENPEDGEMMMSLLWYYRPEHTEQGRLPADQPDEVFASRHKDSNSVACIDDKCYVLTFNEYCRYRKTYKRIEAGIEEALPCIPNPEPYPRSHRQPPMTLVSPEMVFFCRRVYDFRQKRIMKNPT